MKTYNYRLVKTCRSYRIFEICELFNVCETTIKNWIKKEGLKLVDPDSKPYLITGVELKKFLKQRSKKNKTKLKPDEFFCLKCRIPVKSESSDIVHTNTGRYFYSGCQQVIVSGKCTSCAAKLNRFSSTKLTEK